MDIPGKILKRKLEKREQKKKEELKRKLEDAVNISLFL